MARRGSSETLPVAIWVHEASRDALSVRAAVRRRLERDVGVAIEGEIDAEPILLVRASSPQIDRILELDEVAGLYLYQVEGPDER
jgi:hypothetical protein